MNRHGEPMVSRAGYPTESHPESYTRPIEVAAEAQLCQLEDRLWPRQEWRAIVRAYPWIQGGAA